MRQLTHRSDDGGGEPRARFGVEGGVPEPRGGGVPRLVAVGDLFAHVESLLVVAGVVGEPVVGIDFAFGDLITTGAETGLGGMETSGAPGGAPEDDLAAGGPEGGDLAGEVGSEGVFEFGRLDEMKGCAFEVGGPFGKLGGDGLVPM